MNVLERIQAQLDARGWTYYRLAKQMNKPTNTISDMFSRNTLPSLGTLESICNAFGITMTEFFAEDGEAVILSERQQKLLDMFSLLDEHDKQLAEAYLCGLSKKPISLE